jgi:glycosyltransferase involved in cell wall biosynthesis
MSESFLKEFTVIIPAYNEEKRIGPVLLDLCHFISENKLRWNIIVSIDGNDDTDKVVKQMMTNFLFLSYLKGNGRSGKGEAIKRAVHLATGEYYILMDADNSIGLSEILSGIPELEKNDVVILERYTSDFNQIPFLRRFASRGFNILVQALLGLRVKDTQSGYKIIKSDFARRSFDSMTVTNTFFDVALLYKIKKLGGKITEKPVKYRHDEESKFNVFSEIVGQGVSLFAFRIRHSPFYAYIPKNLRDLYYRKFRWI